RGRATLPRAARHAGWSRRPKSSSGRDFLLRAVVELEGRRYAQFAPALIVEQVAVHEHHAIHDAERPVTLGAPRHLRFRSVRLRAGRVGGEGSQLDFTDLTLVGVD